MLPYILMFSLVAVIILGVIRASKNHRLGLRPKKEPFVGAAGTSEKHDNLETVGKPRVIGYHAESSKSSSKIYRKPLTFAEKIPPPITPQKSGYRDIFAADLNQPTTNATITEKTPQQAAPTQRLENDIDDINDVVVITLIADDANPYAGYKLLQSLLTIGLRYGKWDIFHRHQENNASGPILFSLASISNPGTFDLTKMGGFSTPGLALFMRISELNTPSAALEMLLKTTNQLALELGGTICDGKRIPLTAQKINHWYSIVAKLNT